MTDIDYSTLRGDLKEMHYKLGRWNESIRAQDNFEEDGSMEMRELGEGYIWPAFKAVDEALDYVKWH